MRSIALAVLFACLLAAGSASADSVFTIRADSTLSGNSGHILRVTEPGFPGEEFFVTNEGGVWRMFATQSDDSPTWEIIDPPEYVVPVSSMTVGQTWNFIGDFGVVREAEAIGMESVTVPAGTFNAWRVDVTEAGAPAGTYNSMYWVAGIGLILEEEYLNGNLDYASELQSYTVSGSGFFPMLVGNSWVFADLIVATETSSVGELKARFGD